MNIPLKYKDRRTEGKTVLRQSQLVQLHLLHVFDAICKEHGLEYVLDGGTLIGAMRHNGVIPWDDDIDVGMPKRDYNRFLKIAARELPRDVILQTPDTAPERVMAFCKLRDAYSFYGEPSFGMSLKRPNGIFIDIFPYENMPAIGAWLERKCVLAMKRAYHYGRALRCSGGRGWLFALFGGWLALPLYAVHYAVKIPMIILRHVLPCRNFYYDFRTQFPARRTISAMYPLRTHPFEDGEFPIPNDPDTILSEHYGDWRTPPPKEEIEKLPHANLILPFQTCLVSGAMEWK